MISKPQQVRTVKICFWCVLDVSRHSVLLAGHSKKHLMEAPPWHMFLQSLRQKEGSMTLEGLTSSHTYPCNIALVSHTDVLSFNWSKEGETECFLSHSTDYHRNHYGSRDHTVYFYVEASLLVAPGVYLISSTSLFL